MTATFNEIHDNINMISGLAKDNYDKRNGIIDRFNDEYEANGEPRRCHHIKGECNYYIPVLNDKYQKVDEIKVECDVIPVIKGGYRYIYRLNDRKVARKNLVNEILKLMIP